MLDFGGLILSDIYLIVMEQKLREENKERLQNILRVSKETESIAQNTCVELKNQGDCIDRIAEKNSQVSQNIDKSERLVRGMGSFFGRVKNYFSKPKPTESLKTQSNNTKGPQFDESVKKIQNKTPGIVNNETRERKVIEDDEEDKCLDEIINSVDNLKFMAKNISETLDDQNRKLDLVSDATDRNNTRLNHLNYKAKKLLV